MTFDEKIKALNDLAVAWYSTSQADSIHEAIFRGQGYGLSAMQALEKYALEVLHLHQLYAVIDACNETCLQLFRQLGYHESSRLKEWLFDGREYCDAIVMQTFF